MSRRTTARRASAATPRLNRCLALEDPRRTSDGAGGFLEAWQLLGHHWCEMRALTGRSTDQSGTSLSLQRYRITLRAHPTGSPARPRPDQRLRDGARIFRIDAVAEGDPDGRFLTCFATEETSA
ncbi:head-tail adaptor protein [Phaeobacter gallaeciensis]|uniref:Gene transfer agent head-tail adaptor n=1 Tax=Phaeobacter gallaeciensis TaxID=60890 RepID=A0AAC9Z8X1_9RHOB|nr:head-tail adaptor protein [Phaeobacter gallaeciensis]AHD09315.1 Bacteriophage head-tail adaptor [Phaeobacter gallaeciensis DSM 26640]ATE92578.1 putative gene transfer agent head-tail adaptor [Phaeobacter gallaeciensis]ATE97600.1 putative gene transfer agent head-tail adaptor [Phaeobacter gallaeciensis]ATF01243.1 putative gene transfer agent head-tail adaptor [Phaeobacter gallaeciensis]ATF05623.1 putative gene transfer agent head-tail adaptor [Phaeobacter gallaeciensis]